MSNGNPWSIEVWMQFNGDPKDKTQPGLLKATMGPMQVAQHVFPTIVTGNDTSFSADKIDLNTGVPTTGATRSFATLRKPFTLFPVHAADPALTMASNQVTLAAQALARYCFFGVNENAPEITINRGDSRRAEVRERLKYHARSPI